MRQKRHSFLVIALAIRLVSGAGLAVEIIVYQRRFNGLSYCMATQHLKQHKASWLLLNLLVIGEMWSEAFPQSKDIYEETKTQEDFMFCGREESLSALKFNDVILNYDMYGDLVSVNADSGNDVTK